MKQWAVISKIKNNFIIIFSSLKKGEWRGFKNSAFTMVEALVVIVIFSILSASIAASFISGMKIWSRAQKVTARQTDILINLEKISSELRQIITIPQIVCEGDSTQVSFARVHNNSIYKVSYIFDTEEKILARGQVDLKYILEGKEEENRVEKNLISLDEFSLSYLYLDTQDNSYKWKDNWESADGRFLAVKIQEKLKDEEFKRTIFIPTAN